MIQRARTTTPTRPLLMILAATLIVLAAPAMGDQGAAAQPGITYEVEDFESGNFCVQDYTPGATCTANDVRITNITPTLQETCEAVGDTATATFTVQVVSGASTRYDVGLFVATDGGSALSGNACYHDYLQPGSRTPNWDLTGGHGPFKEFDPEPDACADILQDDGPNFYIFQAAITVVCKDADGNGVVDAISTCTSWDNNVGANCLNVKGAFPSTKSKCHCRDIVLTPEILIYRGYDWGDLPDTYKTLLASDGARHAIQDLNNDQVPDTQGGIVAVWLGTSADFSPAAETDGQPNATATGDDLNHTDDENGVQATGTPWTWGIGGGHVLVNVNSSAGTCTGCRLGFWIDWNQDGDFADAGEAYVRPVVFGSQTLAFDIPVSAQLTNIYARFRLYDGHYVGTPQSSGLVVNGEVEDYYFQIPTDVDLLWFRAEGRIGFVKVGWETVSEINNLGFNLYRATTLDGPKTKLNQTLIPTNVPPGSPFGAVYTYRDWTAQPGERYFYWLEDVDIYGNTGLHGPRVARVW